VLEEVWARLVCETVHGARLAPVTETPDDLLESEDTPDESDGGERDEDDDPGLSAEESLGLLPPD
jgi:hypothetical protein